MSPNRALIFFTVYCSLLSRMSGFPFECEFDVASHDPSLHRSAFDGNMMKVSELIQQKSDVNLQRPGVRCLVALLFVSFFIFFCVVGLQNSVNGCHWENAHACGRSSDSDQSRY